MSLGVTVKRVKEMRCPHCGKVAGYETLDVYHTGSSEWEDFLTRIGYYPSEEWYAEDKLLTEDEARAMVEAMLDKSAFNYQALELFVALASHEGNKIIINANW